MTSGRSDTPRTVIVVASLAWSLVNFRGQLLTDLVAAGHRVIAVAPEADPDIERQLAARGVAYRVVPMRRAAISVVADLGTLRALVSLFRAERPDTVLAYTQKPIVYAGLAARIVGGIEFFAMVSGLGHAFSERGGLGRAVLRSVVAGMYRHALARAAGAFVFNSDDRGEMLRHGMIAPDLPVVQVPGSGIDVQLFARAPLPAGAPIFLLVARLLRNKGLDEFVVAAREIRARHPDVRFQLLGPHDANPAAVAPDELAAWQAEGTVVYLGETRDVAPYFAAASVFVLPTWYREGLPRTILEAMATGRAVITSDAPGCRDAVTNGWNGLLVPPRDSQALAAAMQRFVDDPGLAATMGARARERAEAVYDVREVNLLLLTAMGLQPAPARVDAREPAACIA